jgi:integrase
VPAHSPSPHVPKYRHYKPKDLAVVRIDGRDVYLGKYDSPESHEKYRRTIAEWLSGTPTASPPQQAAAPGLTVAELILAYHKHAEAYYVKNGRPTSEVRNIRLALRPLRRLYGLTLAADFGPKALKLVRQAMIDDGLCRREVNKRVRHVIRAFKWAGGEELVPPALHHGLKAVGGLKKNRSGVRESEEVEPVPDATVDAIRPHVPAQVNAMMTLQQLSAMRPGEACIMRTGDIDRSGAVWEYRPYDHKTAHLGHERIVYLGPEAQATLKPWLRADPEAYLFQPCEAAEATLARRRRERKSPMPPSRAARKRKPNRRRAPGDHYPVTSYRQAIIRGCDRAGVPRFHPHQLRHTAGTRIRKTHGLDVAQVILGHRSADITELYARPDRDKARAVMGRVG